MQIIVINKERKSKLNSRRVYTTFYWSIYSLNYAGMMGYFLYADSYVQKNDN